MKKQELINLITLNKRMVKYYKGTIKARSAILTKFNNLDKKYIKKAIANIAYFEKKLKKLG